MDNPSDSEEKSNLIRLHDYFKYMYDEEKHRTEHLNTSTNTYLVFITFAFTFTAGLINWLSPHLEGLLSTKPTIINIGLMSLLGISILLLVSSLILTVLVVKVRNFERLCNPIDFAEKASLIEEEIELISSVTSHFVVATERNHQVNNKKTKYLTYSMQTYILGFCLFLISITLILLSGRN